MIKFKLPRFFFALFATIIFFQVGPSRAENLLDQYYKASGAGQYTKSSKIAKLYVEKMDTNNGWNSPWSRANFIVRFGRYAALFLDQKSLSWVKRELDRFLKLKDQSHHNKMNIALRMDAPICNYYKHSHKKQN
ncbi:MAG: hypothetical protein ACJZ9G_03295 [Rhodospirillales bacterium]